MATRFTEAQKQAALADLKNGMTLEQAAKKNRCSANSLMQWKKALGASAKAVKRTPAKVVGSAAKPSVQTDRLVELEGENEHLKAENQVLRSLMLDGYIATEPHPKLKQIAQTLREAGENQLQRIMEILLVAEVDAPASSESLERTESAVPSDNSNDLPQHSSGSTKLRRKADIEA